MNRTSSDIVIGIDFGTTRDVRLITNWPNPKRLIATNDKVPSTISYKGGQVHKWGYSNNDPKEEVIQWFKILLEASHKYNEEVQEVKNSSKILKELNKLPEEVVADYLRMLWEFTMEDIQREVTEDSLKRDYTRQVVITVPAMWSDAAKEKTRKATQIAGIDGKIIVITEPEAAALSVLKHRADNEAINVSFHA